MFHRNIGQLIPEYVTFQKTVLFIVTAAGMPLLLPVSCFDDGGNEFLRNVGLSLNNTELNLDESKGKKSKLSL
jgi:hypothetical protein